VTPLALLAPAAKVTPLALLAPAAKVTPLALLAPAAKVTPLALLAPKVTPLPRLPRRAPAAKARRGDLVRSSLSRTVRAVPTLLRVGVAETVAYRAEFLVWILTTTQPLVMLGLWTSVGREGPFQGYTEAGFVAYYLSVLIVRNLTGSWVGWQLSEEIRTGAMSMRLLRPIHPFIAFATSHLAAIPFRTIIALPVAVILLISSGGSTLATDPVQLALIVPSIAMAWLITFAILFGIGSLGFFFTKTIAIADVYFTLFSLLSGYLLPLSLLPGWIATWASYTPFPSLLSTPVLLMTKSLPGAELARLLAVQAGWAVGLVALALVVWRAGVRRYEEVGG
jgi:ABC-2 type transport system permease protein